MFSLSLSSDSFVFATPTRNVKIKMYEATMLSVTLHGRDIWSLAKGGTKTQVFKKKVLRRMFGGAEEN
jgi:hypothetical protein